MDRTFGQALEDASKTEKATSDFVETALELAKEIALRGATGGILTDTERQFVKAATTMIVRSVLRQGDAAI